jgi:hypothetical protein
MTQRQEPLNGVIEYNEELTKAGRELREHREARMSEQKKEQDAEKKCLALLHLHGLDVYVDDSEEPAVRLKITRGKEKVSIAANDKDDSEADD